MKATLYDALGVSRLASQEEIRLAVRQHIRKYYANTRDGHGNLEEALRFINHASCILSDPARRAAYDQELAISDGSLEQRIQHVVSSAAVRSDERSKAPSVFGADNSRSAADAAAVIPASSIHPGLIEHVGSLPHATSIAIAACASFIVLVAAAIVFVTPADAMVVAKHVLITLTVGLVSLAAVYAVVHFISSRYRSRGTDSNMTSQDEHAMINWRREKAVFFGSQAPHEDAGWIFKLRMAELERAKAVRTSQPHLWNRLGARLFDYALWGLTLAFMVSQLRLLGVLSTPLAYWLMHPLLAPILICTTWMPIEALLNVFAGTTPGKWLFGVYLQFSISDPYAARDRRTQLKHTLRRALRVWWHGVGAGIPVLSPVLMAMAYEHFRREQETTWDAALDCLVTHVPPSAVNTATGVAGFVAMLWLYGVAWHPVMQHSIDSARSSVIAVLPSPAFWPAAWNLDGRSLNVGSVRDLMMPALQRPGTRGDGSPLPANANGDRSAIAGQPIDPELAKMFAERHARIDRVSSEGLRALEARQWRRARELCRQWVDLDLGNAGAWRCVGRALQGEGRHQEAVNALRKAKQYDPDDRSLDAAINRSQQAIVAHFLATAR